MENFQKEIQEANELRKANILSNFSNSEDLIKGGKTPRQLAVDKLNKISRDDKDAKYEAAMATKEGSRGGKVIGHTKSRKPIYSKNNEIKKDMSAGAVTGTDTTNQPSSGASVKQESLFGVKKKKHN